MNNWGPLSHREVGHPLGQAQTNWAHQPSHRVSSWKHINVIFGQWHLALSVGTITVENRFPKEAPCCPTRDLQYLLLEPGALTFHGANLDLSHRHLPWWQRTPGINGPGHNFLSIPTTVEGANMSRYQALSLSLAGLHHSRNLSTFIGKMHVESSQCRGKMSVGSYGRTSRPGPELRGPYPKA
jgi:hypothetical protein